MTEIREDMLKVKRMVSEVEIILGKREGETELVNKLIDAENLLTYCMSRLENAIVPPCKVGEELYCVYSPPHPANPADKGKWYMDKFEVARFHYGVKGLSIEMYGYGTVNANEIGKTVFIGENAKEEAEKALKERETE